MLDGSHIATISDGPARLTGMTRCFSADLLRDQLDDLRRRCRSPSRLIAGTPYCFERKSVSFVLLDGARLISAVPSGAALLLLFLRFAQLLDRDEVLANQQFTQTTGHACFPPVELRALARGAELRAVRRP